MPSRTSCRFLGALLLLGGCAAPLPPADGAAGNAEAPIIAALSTNQAAVGDEVRLSGSGFPSLNDGWVDVTFSGTFQPDGGGPTEPVDLTIPLQADSSGDLVWQSFGAYRVPFSQTGDQIGVFHGTVSAKNRYFDGRSLSTPAGEELPLTFTVQPSLVVKDFRAEDTTWVADCAVPAANAINLVPYGMRVAAVGFEPYDFEYFISEGLIVDGNVAQGVTHIRYPTEPGENQHATLMQFAPVPANVDGYAVGIRVRAEGLDGVTREITYPFTVRRPLQVYFTGPEKIAKIYPPEPVSGCIPGGPSSVEVAYSESHSETRSRSIQHTVNQGWENTYTQQTTAMNGGSTMEGDTSTRSSNVTQTDTRSSGLDTNTTNSFSATDGRTRVNNIQFTQSDSNSYGWSVNDTTSTQLSQESGLNVETGASGTVGGSILVADASATAHLNVANEAKTGFVNGSEQAQGSNGSQMVDKTSSSGATNGQTQAQTEAQARAEGHHWDLTQSYAEQNGYSDAQTFQQGRSWSEAESQSQAIAATMGTSDTELLSVSTTDSHSLNTTAHVWAGQYGVWYRQTTRLVRQADLVAYDLCGNAAKVGTMSLDDWAWAPDLALGSSCPPPSNLPPAECRISPCSGGG